VGEELVSSALAAGARGYLSKRLAAERLVSDLERIDAGEVVVDLGARHVDGAALLPPSCDPAVHLSARESQVLVLVASGLSNREIAAQCFLSINSVKTYIRSTYRKDRSVHPHPGCPVGTRARFATSTACDDRRSRAVRKELVTGARSRPARAWPKGLAGSRLARLGR
jgi:FixJ family two-component response regulator